MSTDEANDARQGSSPVGRGGVGAYIEGELGAFYLLTILARIEPRGLPGSQVLRVRFQGVELGHPMRSRIDALMGRLVSLGAPGAYDLEERIRRA